MNNQLIDYFKEGVDGIDVIRNTDKIQKYVSTNEIDVNTYTQLNVANQMYTTFMEWYNNLHIY
jgi:hypothetical protein